MRRSKYISSNHIVFPNLTLPFRLQALAMHRCLLLNEILEVIFDFVFNSMKVVDLRSASNCHQIPYILPSCYHHDRRSVFCLALTCHAFRDIAFGLLYSHLCSIRPLIKSLPHSELVFSGTASLVLTSEQFNSSIPYAARVKFLFMQYDYHGTVYATLLASAPKDTLIFPNLRSLTWYDGRITSIPVLRLFLPTLETLSIDITETSFRQAIIPDLHITAPHLKALELMGNYVATQSEIELLLLTYPEGLTKFSFQCCTISSGLLDVIATWPRLRWLTLQLGPESIPSVPLHAPQMFQALTHLNISCNNFGIFTSFLRAFRMLRMDSDTYSLECPNLKTIHINAKECNTSSTWSELLSSLTCTKLEHLIIEELCDWFSCTLAVFDFHPLLAHTIALAELKTLVLIPNGYTSTITLTDTDIITLARTCPYLTVLDLGVRNTPISLYALNFLVRRCRELRRASVCVNAELDALGRTLPKNDVDNDQGGLQSNTQLFQLHVGGKSPIACVGPLRPSTAPDLMMSIPRFLHAMAPRLESIMKILPEGKYGQRWEMVSDALSVMVKDSAKES